VTSPRSRSHRSAHLSFSQVPVSRDVCEKWLKEQDYPPGTFIVREKSKGKYVEWHLCSVEQTMCSVEQNKICAPCNSICVTIALNNICASWNSLCVCQTCAHSIPFICCAQIATICAIVSLCDLVSHTRTHTHIRTHTHTHTYIHTRYALSMVYRKGTIKHLMISLNGRTWELGDVQVS
jgi:hypothetical protein